MIALVPDCILSVMLNSQPTHSEHHLMTSIHIYVVRTDRDNQLEINVYCTIHGKEDRSIGQAPRKSFSFSGCNIIFTEIDAHAFQVGICESGRSLPCRRLFALPLAHWRLYYRSLRCRLL
jgi:hypothetical protein